MSHDALRDLVTAGELSATLAAQITLLADAGVPIVSRGAGTGLAGGARPDVKTAVAQPPDLPGAPNAFAFAEAAIDNVAAILCHLRAHPGFDQLPDLHDDISISGIVIGGGFLHGAGEQRRPAGEMINQHAQNLRLQRRPVSTRRVPSDRNKIMAKEHPVHIAQCE